MLASRVPAAHRFCASIYARKTAFMRVRWPSACFLNHSNTSLSMRRWTEVLPLGMATRARFDAQRRVGTPRTTATAADKNVRSTRVRYPAVSAFWRPTLREKAAKNGAPSGLVVSAKPMVVAGERQRFCASTLERKIAFMRGRWPSPCFLSHSNMSLLMRRWTEVLPLGMATRARFDAQRRVGDARTTATAADKNVRSTCVQSSAVSAFWWPTLREKAAKNGAPSGLVVSAKPQVVSLSG